jgi:transmembrane sensor
MKDDFFNDLILKFLNGDATPHEKRMLSDWLKEEAGGEEVFYHHLSRRESDNPQHLPDVSSKLEAYERYLAGESSTAGRKLRRFPGDAPARFPSLNRMLLLAASVVFVMSAALYFFQDTLLYKTYTAGKGVIRSVVLEDGSTVTLSANSSIKFLRGFMHHDSRRIWIEGEAFFEVTKKSNGMKFVVHTKNFDVEVLGTRFNVKSRDEKSEVILAEGSVKLVAKDREPFIMKPGEKVTLVGAQARFNKQLLNEEEYAAWRNRLLVFDDTPLLKVAQVVGNHYGVTMLISDSLLSTRKFTGSLPNNDIEVVLQALTTAYEITIERNGKHIILK